MVGVESRVIGVAKSAAGAENAPLDVLILLCFDSIPFRVLTGDKQSGLGSSNGRSFNDGSRDGARDRRSGTGSGSDSFGEADRRLGYTPPYEEELDR